MPRTISDTMVKPPPTPCRFVASLYSQVAVRFLLRQVHPLIRFSTTVPLLLLLFFIHSFFPLSFPFFPLFFFPFREISPRRCDGTERDGNRVPSTTLFLISAVQLSRSTRNEERSEFIATGCIGRRLLTLVIPTPIGSRAITRNSDPKTFVRVRFEYCSGEDLPLKMSRGLWTHLINVESNDILTIPPRSSREICTYKQFCSYIYILGTNGRLYLEPRISRETLSAEKEEK